MVGGAKRHILFVVIDLARIHYRTL